MAVSSHWPVPVMGGTCYHGIPMGVQCWLCLNPSAWPQAQPARLGGWSCPGCLRCFSPSLTECPYCPAQKPADVLDTPEPGTGAAVPCPCQPGAEGALCGCQEDDGS